MRITGAKSVRCSQWSHPAWGRAPPTSALSVWLAAHCHRDHGTAPDILTLKTRPVGGPYHRHLGPHYSGCPILRSLAPSQALAQDERLRGRPGSEAGVEGHKAELAPGHGDLQVQLGSAGNLGSWTPIEEAKTYAESPLPAPPPPGARESDCRLVWPSSAPGSLQPWLYYEFALCDLVEVHCSTRAST